MGNPQFIQFVSSHNKSYRSHRELTQRAQVFASNVAQIRQLNQVSEASGKSNAARYDVNEFTDMSSAEFGEMLGWKEDPELLGHWLGRPRFHSLRDRRRCWRLRYELLYRIRRHVSLATCNPTTHCLTFESRI